jgi:hypothetical protein
VTLEDIEVGRDVGGPVLACGLVPGVEQTGDDLLGPLSLGELEPHGGLLVGEREPLPAFAVLISPGAQVPRRASGLLGSLSFSCGDSRHGALLFVSILDQPAGLKRILPVRAAAGPRCTATA